MMDASVKTPGAQKKEIKISIRISPEFETILTTHAKEADIEKSDFIRGLLRRSLGGKVNK